MDQPKQMTIGQDGRIVDAGNTGGVIYDGGAQRAAAHEKQQERINRNAFEEFLAVLAWAHKGRDSYAREQWASFMRLMRDV
jgi:hypothetical protein